MNPIASCNKVKMMHGEIKGGKSEIFEKSSLESLTRLLRLIIDVGCLQESINGKMKKESFIF